jgi:hypothetical protein
MKIISGQQTALRLDPERILGERRYLRPKMDQQDVSQNVQRMLRAPNTTRTERSIVLALALIGGMSTAEHIQEIIRVPKRQFNKALKRLVSADVVYRLDMETSIEGDEWCPLYELATETGFAGYPQRNKLSATESSINW